MSDGSVSEVPNETKHPPTIVIGSELLLVSEWDDRLLKDTADTTQTVQTYVMSINIEGKLFGTGKEE